MNRVRPALAAGLLLAATAAIAPAQEGAPGMLRDIAKPGVYHAPLILQGPVLFVPLGSFLYFDSWEAASGQELWRSDGTRAGTTPVRDICPGACHGRVESELVVSGGALYFAADDGEHGTELWRSDGTALGSWMLADILPGEASSRPSFLTPAPGGLYFSAHDGSHGRELWWTDGTPAGTRMVADLQPGPPAGFQNGPSHLVMLGNLLIFATEDGVHGREPWRTDGSPAGTSLLADTHPGPAGGLEFSTSHLPGLSALNPTTAGGRVFFGASNDDFDRVPWVTDGTSPGTVALVTAGPGVSFDTRHLFAFGDIVLFGGGIVGQTLWRSDGTPGGTVPLGTGEFPRLSGAFAVLGDRALFPGGDDAAGIELWATDGTAGGTELVKDVLPGAPSGLGPTRGVFVSTGSRLFFAADDGTGALALWASDGTPEGTTTAAALVPAVAAGFLIFNPMLPAQVGNFLLYEALDLPEDFPAAPGGGYVVRALDLAGGSVSDLLDTAERPGSVPLCHLPDKPCAQAEPGPAGIVFAANDGLPAAQVWTSDGHPAGTKSRTALAPPSFLASVEPRGSFATAGDRVLFFASDAGNLSQVFAATPSGVEQLTHFEHQGFIRFATWKGAAYFGTAEGLWRSDGTAQGTVQLAGGDCTLGELVPATTELFFLNFGRLWATDGTVERTRRVAPAIDLFVSLMAATTQDGTQRVYLAGYDSVAGRELWVSDGSDPGTRRVADLRQGPEGSIGDDPSKVNEVNRILIATGGRAYFVADSGAGGEELWVSDGSPGDASVLYAWPGAGSAAPRWLAATGDRVYFVADDGIHGREPWVTQGTQETTRLLADLRPGPASSAARELTAWGDRLVFAADDGVHGMELWRTGTTDLDHDPPVMHEIRPGPRPSSPMGLTISNGRLFFFADDGVHGLEPWAWPIGGRFFADGFDSGDTAAWEGLQ